MQRRLLSYALLGLLYLPLTGQAGSISTDEIITETTNASLACMRWMPVGVCFWLRCSIYECDVETSLKVAHYQPDAVVSSYNELGGNPWTDIRDLLGVAQQTAAEGLLGSLLAVPVDVASAGNRTEGGQGNKDHRNLIYRETDVVGHPLSSLYEFVSGTGYLCPSETTSFYPYFLSALDAIAWRTELPEMLYSASWLPGQREIGHWPTQTWGSVYPRTGWATQAEEPKAAAITAQRAGDIVTRQRQPHIYSAIEPSSSSGQKVWSPGPLVEGDAATGVWQMLVPKVESSCAVFGTNDLASTTGWGGGRVDEEGDYVWNLWRPYACCEKQGQLFLFDINWIDYPP